MSSVRISLGSFFRKQTAETAPETPPTGEQSTPPSDESTGGEEDPEKPEGESETPPAADGETPPAAQGSEGGQVIQMTQAAYNQQVADAADWNKYKGELDTLRAWKASLDGVGRGVSRGGDQNTSGKQTPTVHDQPWNQAAQEAAAKKA